MNEKLLNSAPIVSDPYRDLMRAIGLLDEEKGIQIQNTGEQGTLAMAFAMSGLTAREEKILYLRFWHGMTYEEVGKEFDVTRERIRQVEHKALRKMRKSSDVRELLQIGILAYFNKEVRIAARERAAEYEKQLREQYQARGEASPGQANSGTSEPADSEKESLTVDAPDNQILAMPIEWLDLGVRPYNCLKRAFINTVGDLVSRTHDQLSAVRNMGKGSLSNIEIKLEQHKLSLAPYPKRVSPVLIMEKENPMESYCICPCCNRLVDEKINKDYCGICGTAFDWSVIKIKKGEYKDE